VKGESPRAGRQLSRSKNIPGRPRQCVFHFRPPKGFEGQSAGQLPRRRRNASTKEDLPRKNWSHLKPMQIKIEKPALLRRRRVSRRVIETQGWQNSLTARQRSSRQTSIQKILREGPAGISDESARTFGRIDQQEQILRSKAGFWSSGWEVTSTWGDMGPKDPGNVHKVEAPPEGTGVTPASLECSTPPPKNGPGLRQRPNLLAPA